MTFEYCAKLQNERPNYTLTSLNRLCDATGVEYPTKSHAGVHCGTICRRTGSIHDWRMPPAHLIYSAKRGYCAVSGDHPRFIKEILRRNSGNLYLHWQHDQFECFGDFWSTPIIIGEDSTLKSRSKLL